MIGAMLMLMSTSALAQPAAPAAKSSRNFVAKFKKIADDCKNPTVKFGVTQVTISALRKKRGRMSLGPGLLLKGSLAGARFSMTTRRGNAVITASGSVRKGVVSMLVIAEHYRGKTPVCTQTWNAKGKRGKLRRAP